MKTLVAFLALALFVPALAHADVISPNPVRDACGGKKAGDACELDGKPGPIVVETVIHFRRNLVPELPPEEAPSAPEPGVTPPAGSAVLEGTVKERGTRRNLAGVSVALLEQKRETETDVEGRFRFDGVPAGTHHVVALRTGYVRFSETVTLADNETSDVVLYLRTAGWLWAVGK